MYFDSLFQYVEAHTKRRYVDDDADDILFCSFRRFFCSFAVCVKLFFELLYAAQTAAESNYSTRNDEQKKQPWSAYRAYQDQLVCVAAATIDFFSVAFLLFHCTYTTL